MKMLKYICAVAAIMAVTKVHSVAAPASDFLSKVTLSPVAALTHEHLNGAGVFSTGIDIGASVNPFVSIHATAMASERDDCRGSVVDESEIYGRANFVRYAKDTFFLYGKGGVVRDWQDDLWGFGIGAGVEWRFTKTISIAADYTVRAWFKDQPYDGQSRALLNISF